MLNHNPLKANGKAAKTKDKTLKADRPTRDMETKFKIRYIPVDFITNVGTDGKEIGLIK